MDQGPPGGPPGGPQSQCWRSGSTNNPTNPNNPINPMMTAVQTEAVISNRGGPAGLIATSRNGGHGGWPQPQPPPPQATTLPFENC